MTSIRAFLTRHNLQAYADAFEAQGVTVEDLPDLTDDHLRAELGMTSFADRRRFRAAAATDAEPAIPPNPALRDLSGATRVLPYGARSSETSGGAAAESALPARLGSYRILGQVGAGGMGYVVRARHVEEAWALHQSGDVAIKLIHPHIAASPEFRARFISEAALGRRIQHVGIVPIWEVLSDGTWLGTVMSYVEGEPLSRYVRPGGMPLEDLLCLLGPVGEALDYLHGQGIVHRDVKPANIVVRVDGRPVLLDLGIAKDLHAASSHTRTTTSLGTSVWMAPEQVDAKQVDGAADRYAFGLMAYALLTGRLPWPEGVAEARILANKLFGQLETLRSARPEIPASVDSVVMRMLAVSPEERFESCARFLTALRAGSEEGAEREARAAAEREARERAAREARERTERDVRAAAEREARERAAREARERVERDVRAAAEREARERAEREARAAAEREAQKRKEREAREQSQAAMRSLAQAEERARAEKTPQVVQPDERIAGTSGASEPAKVAVETPERGGKGILAMVLGVAILGALGMLRFAGSRGEEAGEEAPEPASTATPASLPSVPAPPPLPTPLKARTVADKPSVPGRVRAPALAEKPEQTYGFRASGGSAPKAPSPIGPAPSGASKPAAGSSSDMPRAAAPPPPPKPPTGNGKFILQGDASSLTLLGADGSKYGPGTVPEGSYAAQARFPTGVSIRGTVMVKAGETVTLTCSSQMQRCGGWKGSL